MGLITHSDPMTSECRTENWIHTWLSSPHATTDKQSSPIQGAASLLHLYNGKNNSVLFPTSLRNVNFFFHIFTWRCAWKIKHPTLALSYIPFVWRPGNPASIHPSCIKHCEARKKTSPTEIYRYHFPGVNNLLQEYLFLTCTVHELRQPCLPR